MKEAMNKESCRKKTKNEKKIPKKQKINTIKIQEPIKLEGH